MKLNFTLVGILACLIFGLTELGAQSPNFLEVTGPAEVAGTYSIGTQAWGGVLTASSYDGTFVNDGEGVITDACENSVGDLPSNTAAFIDRGDCNFSQKALNAQNARAAVAIICNNLPESDPDGGIIPLGAGDFANFVTIPVVGMSMEDCTRIRAVAEGGTVEMRFFYDCVTPTYTSDEYIWGTNANEGDFGNGIGNWEVANLGARGWEYTTVSNPVWGDNSQGSNCNGFMSFSTSDYYFANTANPLCSFDPGDPVSWCTGSIFSPEIDLTGMDIDNLVCEFQHGAQYFYYGTTSLAASYDGGNTWPDTIIATTGGMNQAALDASPAFAIAPGCTAVSTPYQQNVMRRYALALPSYAGENSVQLQFIHAGNLYDCTIDDVTLMNRPDYVDVEIGQNYVSYAPAWEIPIDQAQEVPLHVDIYNRGTSPTSEVQITAEAYMDGGPVLWTGTNEMFGEQPPNCFLNENLSFNDFYTPQSVGFHNVRFVNTTPGDVNGPDDEVGFRFGVTESKWASVPPPTGTTQVFSRLVRDDPGENGWIGFQWGLAYPFYVPNGNGQTIKEVTFGINDLATNSGSMSVFLYKWTPTSASFPTGNMLDADGFVNANNFQIHPDDTELVGTMAEVWGNRRNTIPVSSGINEDYTNITVTMAAANADNGVVETNSSGELIDVILDDDAQYVLILTMVPSADAELEVRATQTDEASILFPGARDYAYAFNNMTRRTTPLVQSLEQNGSFAEIDDLVWTNSSFADRADFNTPWIEMTFADRTNTEDITAEAEESVDVFPNPVNKSLTVDIQLDKASSEVSFELINVSGAVVKTVRDSNVKSGTYTIDVADLAQGVYNLNVRSDVGFTTRKVIIQR